MSLIRNLISLTILYVFSIYLGMAQPALSQDTILISRLKGEFRFDGIVDDSCWSNLTRLPLVMQMPTFGQPPSQQTDFFITYDDNYIYMSGKMYDKTPEKIMASSRIRDEWSAQNDYFMWIFDSFNDHENGLLFGTTPEGVRVDAAILNDANDPKNPYSKSWNTFWDVKTSRNEKGWFAEIRIPISSLRFQQKNDEVIMGLISFRYMPHAGELDIFPAIPDKWAGVSWMKVSQAQHIVFKGLKNKKPFYIAPYGIAGLNQESKLSSDGNSRSLYSDWELNGGLDLKYGITNNLTLDLSVNTDFAQVEADLAQINLTRFGLFFPEKRTFFLERSSNFSFAFDEMNNLFYSRRIGLSDDNNPIPIYGGARLVGRAGKWDIGFMDMQTYSFEDSDDTTKNLPTENFGVLRLRRQVLNPYSYIGGIITSRVGSDGSYNNAYGLDGIFRILGDNYLDLKWVETFDNAYKNKPKGLENTRIWIDLRNRKQTGFGYDIFAGHSGNLYLPDCGFEQRSNFNQIGTSLLYGWLMKPESKLYSQRFTLSGQQWLENTTNKLQTRLFSAGSILRTKTNAQLNLMISRSTENITDQFTILGSATVLPGKYDYNYLTASLNSSYGKKYFLQTILRVGQFYDGSLLSANLTGTYSFGSGFRIEGIYEFDRVQFPSRDETAIGHIAGIKTLFMFTTQLSFTAFVQYNSASRSILTNLRFRYNPREGNDLFIVFNEGRNTILDYETPPLQKTEGRSVMIKYTYTFVL